MRTTDLDSYKTSAAAHPFLFTAAFLFFLIIIIINVMFLITWIVVLFTGGCCGERGARSAAHVVSGAQAEVGTGPGRLHGNRLF